MMPICAIAGLVSLAFLIALLALIVVATVWLWRRRRPGLADAATARAAVDLRYARGEIDRETYEHIRRTLGTG